MEPGAWRGAGCIGSPESPRPTDIEDAQFRALAAGRDAVAGVAVNRSLLTWDSKTLGRSGSGAFPGVVERLEGHSIAKLAMGEYHGVAIDDGGGVFVWCSMVKGQRHTKLHGDGGSPKFETGQ